MHTFATPEPITLHVELGAGECQVRAEQTDTTTVELVATHGDSHAQELVDRAVVEQRGDQVVVVVPKPKGSLFGRKGEVTATIVLPSTSNVDIRLGSADLQARGALGRSKVSAGSGEVDLEDVTDAVLKTGSGDIRIGTAAGSVSTKSGSAETEIGRIGGGLDFLSGSGDIAVEDVNGAVRGKAGSADIRLGRAGDAVDILVGSGDLEIGRVERGRVAAKSGSGDVTVGVANGTAAYLDIVTGSGETSSSLDASDGPSDSEETVELIIRTGSGDVVLQRA